MAYLIIITLLGITILSLRTNNQWTEHIATMSILYTAEICAST